MYKCTWEEQNSPFLKSLPFVTECRIVFAEASWENGPKCLPPGIAQKASIQTLKVSKNVSWRFLGKDQNVLETILKMFKIPWLSLGKSCTAALNLMWQSHESYYLFIKKPLWNLIRVCPASRFPANRLFGTAIFLSSCLNLLIPAATVFDPKAVIVVRVLQVRYFSPILWLIISPPPPPVSLLYWKARLTNIFLDGWPTCRLHRMLP